MEELVQRNNVLASSVVGSSVGHGRQDLVVRGRLVCVLMERRLNRSRSGREEHYQRLDFCVRMLGNQCQESGAGIKHRSEP